MIKKYLTKLIEETLFKALKEGVDIGEVYCLAVETPTKIYYYSVDLEDEKSGGAAQFISFRRRNISDRVNGKIKIFGTWFDVEDIFYYDDIYRSRRKAILDRKREE